MILFIDLKIIRETMYVGMLLVARLESPFDIVRLTTPSFSDDEDDVDKR